MKKAGILAVATLAFVAMSCKKNQCHECHYDTPNGQVELGERCGDDLENLEASGINVDGTNYEVHCHDH